MIKKSLTIRKFITKIPCITGHFLADLTFYFRGSKLNTKEVINKKIDNNAQLESLVSKLLNCCDE